MMATVEGRAATLLVALLALAGAAPERPVFPPTRDVSVTYRADIAQPGVPQQFVLRYSVALDRARLEGGLPGYVLVDLKSHRATVVFEQMGMMMDAPPNAGLDQALVLDRGKHFVRKGRDRVAGLACTVWDVTADDASGTACVTADGVVLRANGHDRKGRTGSIEATAVQYESQTASLFSPPAGVHRMSIAPGPGGQGLSGLLSGPAAGALLDRLRGQKP